MSQRFLPHLRLRLPQPPAVRRLPRNNKLKTSQNLRYRHRHRRRRLRLRLQLLLLPRYSPHLYSETINLTRYSQLAQLSVRETETELEPELEPKAEPPASAAGGQGLTAVAQYDYEVRVMLPYELDLDHNPWSLTSFDRPQRTTNFPLSKASLSCKSYRKMRIGGLVLVRTAPGVVCSRRRTSLSSKHRQNSSPNLNQRPRKKRRRRHHHHRHHRHRHHPRRPSPPCRSPNLSLHLLLTRASSRWHYTSAHAVPWKVLFDLHWLHIATTLRRIMNCLSATVTGSPRSTLSRMTGGLVATSMAMLGYSQVRVFAMPIFKI